MDLSYTDRQTSFRGVDNPRIAFSGPGGTGKTGLAHKLSKHLEKPYIHEVVRTVGREMGLKGINDLSRDERIMLQTLIAVRQRQLESIHQECGFVSDRCLMDAKIYYRVFFGESKAYDNLAQTQGYDLVIFVPPFGARPTDGFRLTNLSWEEEAESLMRQIPGAVVLQSVSPKDRWDETLEIFNRRFPAD